MWDWLDRVAPILFDASLAAAVLTSIILVLLLVSQQPARRIALARTAILAVLAITPLTALAPWPRFQLVQGLKRPPFPPRQVFVRRASVKTSTGDLPKVDRNTITTIPFIEESERPSHWDRFFEFVRRPIRLIVLAYLAVVGLGLGLGLLGNLGIWRLIRSSSPPSPETQRVFESLLAQDQDSQERAPDVRLRISDRVPRPAVVALRRPTILLPSHFEETPRSVDAQGRSDAEALLRLTLLHELAHARRRDATFQQIGSIAQSIWFFLPQLWFIRSQLRLDQEFLADHVACRAYGTSSEYASSLLNLASPRPPTAQSAPRPGDAASKRSEAPREPGVDLPGVAVSSLGQRLLMLLHCPYRLEPITPHRWLWSLRVAGALATLALANVSVRPPHFALGSSPTSSPEIERVFLAGRTRFQVSDLIIAPDEVAVPCRTDSCVIPYRLPDHYSMTLDVLADESSLSQMRLMNLPLAQEKLHSDHDQSPARGAPGSHASRNAEDNREHWHSVRIERDDHGITLTVDHHMLPHASLPANSWIHLESPIGKPVQLRNIIVTPAS